MFEQSILLDQAGKKTRALASSLSAQTLGIGVLILLPLIYNDRMPNARAWMSLALPSLLLRRAPEPVEPAATSQSSRASLSRTRPIFQAPARIAALAQVADTGAVDLEVPAISLGAQTGVPGAIGDAELVSRRIIEEPPIVAQPAVLTKAPEKTLRVGGDVQAARLIRKVVPVYPPLARQARVSGTVRLAGVVAKDGTIQQLQVVSGHPLLVPAALDAVRQWVYRPTLLNGEAVELIAPIDVIFTLGR